MAFLPIACWLILRYGWQREQIRPPHHPNRNAFVERFNRTQEEECLQVHRPTTLPAVQQVTQDFKWHYNHERPNQALSCGNQPPYVAFPSLPKLSPLPDQVDPDRWLRAVHRKRFKRRVKANGSIQVDKQKKGLWRAQPRHNPS
jgi:hypothetical protein